MGLLFASAESGSKKEGIVQRFRLMPKRKLSDVEKQMIFILIEKSKIQRERSMMVLNKGMLIFFAFLIIAYMSKLNNLINESYIEMLFLMAILVLIVAIIAYETVISKEEKTLTELLDSFIR